MLGIILTLGTLLNYTLFLCTLVNSAVATTIVGVFKAILVTLLGFFTFDGQPVTVLLVVGMVANTVGALYYSYVRYEEKLEKTKTKTRQENENENENENSPQMNKTLL